MEFRFNHIGITVSDLDKSIEFYTTLFGLPPGLYVDIVTKSESDGPDVRTQRVAFVPIGETGLIELHEFGPSKEPLGGQIDSVGYAYLCLEVDDLEAAYVRLQEIGADFMAPLRQIYVESADGQEAPMYQKVCDVFDPDGKRVELVENDTRLKTAAINETAVAGRARPNDPHFVRL